jgi:glycerol-3-phosphate acyltransferase PlsY
MSGPLPAPVVFLCAYGLGSVPFGLLIAKAVRGIDIRAFGSGNVGATNVGRTLGRGWFFVVFLLDAAKGGLPVVFFPLLASGEWSDGVLAVGCGLCAVLGHVFSVFLRFRGGKGVATTAGAILAISPPAAGSALLVFLAVFLAFRYVSLASVMAAVAFPALVWWLDPREPVLIFAAVVAVLVAMRHQSNLRRLLQGTEHQISFSRTPSAPSEPSGDPEHDA